MVDSRDLEVLNEVTQDTRFHVVHSILGHPKQSASLNEMNYVLDKSRATISEHLDRLEEADVLDRKVLRQQDIRLGGPSTVYELSEYGTELFESYSLVRKSLAEEYRGSYDEAPDNIQGYIDAPRPV